MAAALRADGVAVIYRAIGDDPQGNPLGQSPQSFVDARCNAAPEAAYIHLTNEIDPSPALNAWTLKALDALEARGRKGCVLNLATHKSRAQWELCRPVLERAAAGGHAIGVHVYLDTVHDDGAWQWVDLMQQIGGLWVLTEFGFIETIFDAERGWRNVFTPEQYARWIADVQPQLAALNTPALWFSYDHWKDDDSGRARGFGFNDAPEVLNQLARSNEDTTMNEIPPRVIKPADATDPRKARMLRAMKLRGGASLTAQVITILPELAEITVYDHAPITADGYTWRYAEHGDKAGFVAALYEGKPTFEYIDLPIGDPPDEEPPVVDPPEPDPEPLPDALYVPLTSDELRQLAELHSAIAGIYRTSLARVQMT